MRIVLDVNVWISALLWDGVPDRIVVLAEIGRIEIVANDRILQELEVTLHRSKFQAKIAEIGSNAREIVDAAMEVIQVYPTISIEVSELRDPKDSIVLAAAIASEAEAIVTGDRDLLVLETFDGIPILTPQVFLDRYFPQTGEP